jgi:hypothetical protein
MKNKTLLKEYIKLFCEKYTAGLTSESESILFDSFKKAKNDREKIEIAKNFDLIVSVILSGNQDAAEKLLQDKESKDLALAAFKDDNKNILKSLPSGNALLKKFLNKNKEEELTIQGFSGRRLKYKD